MSKSNLKLFISYSHKDEKHINDFRAHITPFRENGLIKDWYDRKILPGREWQKEIDNNLDDADIICLFISHHFLGSDACKKELKRAFQLKKERGIAVIPIILSECLWEDNELISKPLVLPKDGNAIANFDDTNVGWKEVCTELKRVLNKLSIIQNLKVTDDFSDFLEDAELFTKAHPNKEEVLLSDIYTYPNLKRYDTNREYEDTLDSKILIQNLYKYPSLLIAGEDQSGKTSLCKKIFQDLRTSFFIPVYLEDGENKYLGNLDNKIEKAFNKQYQNGDFENLTTNRIIPILDNFHYAKHKEKLVNQIKKYDKHIIVVDDIYALNFRDEALIESFTHFELTEFSPLQRNNLIEKWISLSDQQSTNNKNYLYRRLDKNTELVNTTLGKNFGSGIMPSYPFFVLSVITTYEIYNKPLSEEITSQGYCYEALIFSYLKNQGVKNDEIDIYINFLTELAFYIYDNQLKDLPKNDFEIFLDNYSETYNLPIDKELLLNNLLNANLITVDSFNNYSFKHYYIYYFFVAKYLSENIKEHKNDIKTIINNLHNNDKAFICIFLTHHSKDDFILDQIIDQSSKLFQTFNSATLEKEELNFFDQQVDIIAEAALPEETPEQERKKRLKAKEKLQEANLSNSSNNENQNLEEEDFAKELRRAIKTVEVMGLIIKNRAGSIKRNRLEEVFEEGMRIHLRIMTSFLEFIKDEETQEEVIKMLCDRLEKVIEEKNTKPEDEELEKIAKELFWNINFSLIYSFLGKIIHSLGSDKLISIADEVCNKLDTPASFLVNHGILMWYNKNLQLETITNKLREGNFPKTAKNIVRHMVVNHCRMHYIDYKDKQRIEEKLQIPKKKLLEAENSE